MSACIYNVLNLPLIKLLDSFDLYLIKEYYAFIGLDFYLMGRQLYIDTYIQAINC